MEINITLYYNCYKKFISLYKAIIFYVDVKKKKYNLLNIILS